jgi:hypothetical protein
MASRRRAAVGEAVGRRVRPRQAASYFHSAYTQARVRASHSKATASFGPMTA